MVRRHYEVRRIPAGIQVTIYGASGHMGTIRERDGAITKMAHLVRSLVSSKQRLEALAHGPVRLILGASEEAKRRKGFAEPAKPATASINEGSELILEGGQGFVPTHSMREVMDRLRQAAERGAENCIRRLGCSERGNEVVSMAYEKLHNDAFDGDPNSTSAKNAVAAARTCGIWQEEPILGWTVSCDARLFATEYLGLEVLTFGPGQLVHAHSDQEQITIDEIRQAVEFLAVFLLLQTGTLTMNKMQLEK